ncbi:MAG: RHS repeat-associated core domain protein [Candidatus Uhrbacteria bacterium GW2011_GWF2_39_13]|uniref:RHS repeat-associated core domain protein n=1 Tax=Candidatus Uhrbacteria bacterium GW2011_GWF2_39_13 TaxID=1618995 RepID=A0A0G0PX72_9BACT|nr:MAG: RHS repeat-associated core domain protein [Candidatus Uhrbacteria bacterium GW2011_GWF2_39_13]
MTGFNLYQYCGNNPVNRHDPDGTCWHYLGLGDCYTCKAYKEHQEYLASGPATPVGSLEWEIELKVSYGMTAYNFVAASSVVTAGSVAIVAAAAPIAVSAPLYVAPVAAEVAATSTATAKGAQKVFEFVQNKIINLERVGSALQSDAHHAFSNIVDNYAGYATQTPLNNATLYQLQGALNGVAGRFEWIVQAGQVTHRMFVKGGGMNGIPIIK